MKCPERNINEEKVPFRFITKVISIRTGLECLHRSFHQSLKLLKQVGDNQSQQQYILRKLK